MIFFILKIEFKMKNKYQDIWLRLRRMENDGEDIIYNAQSNSNISTARSSSNLIGSNDEPETSTSKRKSYTTLIVLFTLNLINYSDRFTIAGNYYPLATCLF